MIGNRKDRYLFIFLGNTIELKTDILTNGEKFGGCGIKR